MISNPIIPTFLMGFICIIMIMIISRTTKSKTQVIIVLLLLLINQRYMIPTGTSSTLDNNMDVLFVIDSTLSMNAEDYGNKERRLDGVKKDCQKIIEELNGARFSVVTFNNDTKIMAPYTKDAYMAIETIDVIEPISDIYAKGSSLNTPIETMEDILKRSYNRDSSRIRIVFFISDGEITDDSTLKSYSSLKKYINNGKVLGYGTKKGANIPYTDQYSSKNETKYIMYSNNLTYEKAVSKMNEYNLKQISNDLGIPYVHMTQTSNMERHLFTIKSLMKNKMTASNKKTYDDTYYYLVFPLLLLLVLEFKKVRGKAL